MSPVNDNTMAKEFFRIVNASADTLEIDIEGTIGGYEIDWDTWEIKRGATKEAVKKLIKDVANSAASKIIVNINSYGGDINHGVSIHDMLAEHKAKVETVIHGHTASAATIISQAGNVRKMSANALFLVHPASLVAYGNHNDMKTALSDLEKVDNTIAGIYARRTGKTPEEVKEIMNRFDGRGEWLTAQEAKDLGFVDEVFEPMKAVASADPKILNQFGLPQLPTNKINEMKADKKTVFAWFEEFIARIGGKAPQATEGGGGEGEHQPETESATGGENGGENPQPEGEEGEGPEHGEGGTTDRREITIRDHAEVTEVLNDLTTQNENLVTQNADLASRLQNAENEIARLKGLPTNTEAKEDPALDNPTKPTNISAHEQNAKALREK